MPYRNKHGVEIKEAYRGYTPPMNVQATVDRLLASIPSKYVAGLKTIVLTNASGLGHSRKRSRTRSRGRRVAISGCTGLYHQKWNHDPAWIELFVDNMLASCPHLMLRIPPLRDEVVAYVLFHEIGHHVHYTKVPEHQEREDVADRWRDEISQAYFREKYWYIHLLLRPFRPILRLLPSAQAFARKHSNRVSRER